ncbi:MAG: 2,3-bisphosphoglycerate-independent phosphoglycerate mutase [Gemmatimonadetes bacterium]|nr:MAG: 2,3-bisphosphoglycerate-independent phosphoglycerate mutase [Gemmatimonadota bacterium]
MLMILDGWGLSDNPDHNAIAQANLPHWHQWRNSYPHTTIRCSGYDVGLPEGQMGNSEVGHLNLGAGRIVYQDITRINLAIKDGSFFHNTALLGAIEHAKAHHSALHLIGLLSDGGVHSHQDHLYALLKLAKAQGLTRVYIHAIMDGRDTSPTGGEAYLRALQDQIHQIGVGQIASIVGRYYAMDRDKRWERTKLGYDLMTQGLGTKATQPVQAIREFYTKDPRGDEFAHPIVIVDEQNQPTGTIGDQDSIIFFNFRADRARQLTHALVDTDFDGFERPQHPNVHYVMMTQYEDTFDLPVAFPPQSLSRIFGEVVAAHGLNQLRTAETEKYAHVTYFFNGGEETPFEGEDRILIPSPKVPTYDMKPEMSAYELTESTLNQLKTEKYDVVILNFANPDMVGHTGVLEAAVKAVEAVDECANRIIEEVRRQGGIVLVTADHGNAEKMLDYETGKPWTAHTTNLTPLILIDDEYQGTLKPGKLGDIAPTMLELMGIQQPQEMTGESLLVKRNKIPNP